MSIKRLSLEGAQNLISKYKADMNVLDFQLTEMKSVLKELEAHHGKKKKVADKIAAAKAKKANAKEAAATKKANAKKAAAAKKAAKKAAAKAKKSKAKAPKAAAKRGRKPGRPAAKKAAPKKATAKRGRKAGRPAAKKTTARRKSSGGSRGRKMSYSDWDTLVMNSLKGGSSPVRTSVLLKNGTSLAKKLGGKSDEKFVRAKVAASLQKLVNKTKEVKKVPAEGRGFAYVMR